MRLLTRLQRPYKELSSFWLAGKRSRWCTFVVLWRSCQVLSSSMDTAQQKVPPLPVAILSRGHWVQAYALCRLGVQSVIHKCTFWISTSIPCLSACQENYISV